MVTAALLGWALAVILWDVRFREIPNWMILVVLLPAVVLLLINGEGLLGQNWLSSFTGTAVALLVTLPAYARNALGGGDVKCAASIGWILGWPGTAASLVTSGLLLGLTVLALAVRQRASGSPEPVARFPAGPAIAGGFATIVMLVATMRAS